MNKVSTKKLVLNGLMIALVFVVTKFTSFPTFVGYFNVGDVAIMVTAVLLGRESGFIAGAVGSSLADILSGYAIFAPITFVVKGLEGFIVGSIAYPKTSKTPSEVIRIIAVIAGALMMIGGYFVAEMYVMNLYTSGFGYAAAIKDLVSTNLAQGGVSALIGYILTTIIERSNIRRHVL
jgi:ECF transporter S component (folate family)